MSYTAKINTRIDNLRPGVVNLFLNSVDYSGDMWYINSVIIDGSTYNGTKNYKISNVWAGYKYHAKNFIDRNLLKLGDVLTCSCYAKTDNHTEIGFSFYYPGGYSTLGKLNGEWNRFSYTITVTEDILAATELTRKNIFRFEPQAVVMPNAICISPILC